jgi:cytochrome P450
VPTYPKTRRRDFLALLARLLAARLRRADAGVAAVAWLREQTDRYGPNVVIDLIVRRLLFVSDPALSDFVLAAAPSDDTFVAGTAKRKAMSFLAPHALTIAEDGEWRALRSYNEAVLHTGAAHPQLARILDQVKKAFAEPVRDIADVRRRMGEVMLATVFGEGNAPAHLIDDIQTLFAEVGLKTALIGSRKNALRDKFKAEIRGLWKRAAPQLSFVAHGRSAAEGVESPHDREEVLVDQIPHWMFTFTNSGSDLLARSLAMITARDESLSSTRREIEAVRALTDPADVHGLRYLEACILETGRLYPPVLLTSHRAVRTVEFAGFKIPSGMEMIQYFPFGNRDLARDPSAEDFRPERWLDDGGAAFRLYPNLFLSGARACPGRNLILFVIKAAIAISLRENAGSAKRNALSSNPLPFGFPDDCLTFRR